eukprot:sb/3465623/
MDKTRDNNTTTVYNKSNNTFNNQERSLRKTQRPISRPCPFTSPPTSPEKNNSSYRVDTTTRYPPDTAPLRHPVAAKIFENLSRSRLYKTMDSTIIGNGTRNEMLSSTTNNLDVTHDDRSRNKKAAWVFNNLSRSRLYKTNSTICDVTLDKTTLMCKKLEKQDHLAPWERHQSASKDPFDVTLGSRPKQEQISRVYQDISPWERREVASKDPFTTPESSPKREQISKIHEDLPPWEPVTPHQIRDRRVLGSIPSAKQQSGFDTSTPRKSPHDPNKRQPHLKVRSPGKHPKIRSPGNLPHSLMKHSRSPGNSHLSLMKHPRDYTRSPLATRSNQLVPAGGSGGGDLADVPVVQALMREVHNNKKKMKIQLNWNVTVASSDEEDED